MFRNNWKAILVAIICVVFCASALVYISKPEVSNTDTTALDNWCGDYSDGTIRMVGAWMGENGNLMDEQGNEWVVPWELNNESFYLAWIVDNNTPDNPEDDYVMKLWAEVY